VRTQKILIRSDQNLDECSMGEILMVRSDQNLDEGSMGGILMVVGGVGA